MTNSIRSIAAAAVALTLFCAQASHAQTLRSDIEAVVEEYIAAHPEAIERVVKEYLAKHPEAVQQALSDLIKKRLPAVAAKSGLQNSDQKAAIQSNAQLLYQSAHQAVVGNPRGAVTMVEFFDYNCGFCRRALSDTLALLRDDSELRIVLKEFPVLGPASLEAARVSIAVRMQDPAGEKYLEFHRRLLSDSGRVDKSSALAIARDIGIDVTRLEQDLSSDEVRETLEESARLARAIGINGTPGYVIGTAVVPGAVGAAALKEKIALARNNQRD